MIYIVYFQKAALDNLTVITFISNKSRQIIYATKYSIGSARFHTTVSLKIQETHSPIVWIYYKKQNQSGILGSADCEKFCFVLKLVQNKTKKNLWFVILVSPWLFITLISLSVHKLFSTNYELRFYDSWLFVKNQLTQ